MFLKQLIELQILLKKWLLLAQNNKNTPTSKIEDFQKLASALEEAIKSEKEKKSEIELKIIQQSISNQGKVDGSIASTASDFDKKMIPNNQQEVEIVVDFIPSWVYLCAKNKKGLTTINKTDVEGKPTPYDITLKPAELNLELGAEYAAVAYLDSPELDKNTQRKSVSFIYDGSLSLLIQVMNKKSQELEDDLEQNNINYKVLTQKRKEIHQILDNKYKELSTIIEENTNTLIEDYFDFCQIAFAYLPISSSLDTQRKLIEASSSSFLQLFLEEGGKKIIGEVKSIGIIATSTKTGVSWGGISGAIVGFGVGIVIDVIISKQIDSYILEPTESITYKSRKIEINNHVKPIKDTWRNEAKQKINALFQEFKSVKDSIYETDDIAKLNAILKNIEKYKGNERKLQKGTYYKALLKNWVFTNAGDDSNDPKRNIPEDSWQDGLKILFKDGDLHKMKGDNVPAIRYQLDVYLYQIRGLMVSMGMNCGFEQASTNKYSKIVKTIQNRIEKTMKNPNVSIEEQLYEAHCQAFEEHFRLTCQDINYTIDSSEIKITNKVDFIDFFKSSVENQQLAGIIGTFLDEFIKEGKKFNILLEPQLTNSDNSIFLKTLKWTMVVPNWAEKISGIYILDNDN